MAKTQLKDICSFSKGCQINGDKLIENGEYDYLNGGINPSGKWNEYNVSGNTVTISEGGNSSGYVNYMPNSFWCGAHCYYLYDLKCDVKYLYYALKSQQDRIMELRSGACMPNIKKSDIGTFEFEYSSDTNVQKQIAANLDKVTHTIDLCNNILEKLDLLVKSRFVEMFGDPKLNDKGWKSGTVSDYFDVKGGKRIPKGMGYSDRKTNHPYLRATDMKNETIIEDDIHYIDEDVFQHIKRYTVKGGDIYLTNVGVNLGMAGVISQKFDGASLTENAVKLVPKTEKVIDGLFLAHYINSPGIQEYINERKMSVGVPKLAIFRIETMPLLIPPMDVQKDFNAFVEQTDKSKKTVKQVLEKAETLKKALMQEYFG